MRYWLMKTEPQDFSIDDLEERGREPWSGVRNYQSRNYMRDEMRPGDGVLVYHSSCAVPGVYGTGRVAGEAYPDPSQFDRKSKYHDPESTREAPRWQLVDVAYEATFATPVTLDALKSDPALEDLVALRRGNRLSITPVEKSHYERIVALGRAAAAASPARQPSKAPRKASPGATRAAKAGKVAKIAKVAGSARRRARARKP